MKESIGIVFLYLRENKNSFNALIGALEADISLPEYKLYFIKDYKDVINELNILSKNHIKLIFAISFSTPQFWDIQEMLLGIKTFFPNILIVAGGPHPTGSPQTALDLKIDIIVRYEGEETFKEIIKAYNENFMFEKIGGVVFLNNNKKIIDTGRPLTVDLNKSIPISLNHNKYGPIEITRGCPFACSFCQNSYIHGLVPRHRSIETIAKCITFMKEKNLKDFRVISPNAFSYGSIDGKEINLAAIDNLLAKARSILGNNGRIFFGTFPSEVRPEQINEDTLEILRTYVDNDNIIIGAQTASQRLLDSAHRGHTVDDVKKAIELALLFNFKINVDLIFGMPGETVDDIRLTMNFIKSIKRKNVKIHGHFFIPLPQTRFMKLGFKPISEDVRKELMKLSNSGILYGNWQKQELLSLKILKTFR
ncbi:MAG: TIGR04013 family B12-binding domain/radical SAM domain-containing protein [Clostridia bacterium]|nr:TIGR04013 family B12-binding domain/radical SAM domain-containing protein [Clostridia bacterium]